MIQKDVKVKQYLKVTHLGMCLECMPNTGIYVNVSMHKNYLKTKVFFVEKQIPVERLEDILCSTYVKPHFDRACAASYPDISKRSPFLQLTLFEEIFTQGMRLEIQMQNSAAKQSFCIILMVDIHNYI